MDIDNPLFVEFGTRAPRWTLEATRDYLIFEKIDSQQLIEIRLNPLQAETIRACSGQLSTVTLDVPITINEIKLHLIARRTSQLRWEGTAACFDDTASVVESLENALTFAEKIVSEVNCLVVAMDNKGHIRRFNRLCEELTGVKEEQVLGKSAFEFIPAGNDRQQSQSHVANIFSNLLPYEMERNIQTIDGVRLLKWRNSLLKSGSGQEEWILISAGTDITEERRSAEKLSELAHTDSLTGLPNRHAIQLHIANAISEKQSEKFAILLLDLDNFRRINYHYGHDSGDELIVRAASQLQSCLRECDKLARLGGDEFLIVLGGAARPSAEQVAERILAETNGAFDLGRARVYSSVSIGLVLYPEHGTSAEELMRKADSAMYAAKEHGKGNFRTFSADMTRRVDEYVWLDFNLRKALEAFEFELYYQPKVCLNTGKIRSVEALIRWNSPERGQVSPAAFIPYAEESGLIVPLGKWVMREAALQAYTWKRKGLNIRIAINVAAAQLSNEAIISDFELALLDNRLAPSILDIELTESSFMEDELLALERIKRFKELGAEVHLDDFGTGYSSLSQLGRLPIDVVKLDRSFITSALTDSKAHAVVCSMVSVSQTLGLKTVAEGVETEEQVGFLRSIGVDYAQGFYFAKPMPANEFEVWLKKNLNLKLVAAKSARDTLAV
ncbi:MAG TPA: cyclic di-GMP phosphodiesterase [Burkholderiaceae bacterium]|jgi:cyclic di-GMP phosphodiesterase Gmr